MKCPSRRRRRNRPGNAQAKGPRGSWRSGKRPVSLMRPTEGGKPAILLGRLAGKSLRSRDRGGAHRQGSRRAAHLSVSLESVDGRNHSRILRRAARHRGAWAAAAPALKTTPLTARHVALGARMVPFAGYEMPVQYPTGIIAEHNCTRGRAPASSTFRIWARPSCVGADHATTARGARNARAGRYPRPRARPAALHAAPQRGGRHSRRPDGDALGRGGARTAS